jgi:hypothetical protein
MEFAYFRPSRYSLHFWWLKLSCIRNNNSLSYLSLNCVHWSCSTHDPTLEQSNVDNLANSQNHRKGTLSHILSHRSQRLQHPEHPHRPDQGYLSRHHLSKTIFLWQVSLNFVKMLSLAKLSTSLETMYQPKHAFNQLQLGFRCLESKIEHSIHSVH